MALEELQFAREAVMAEVSYRREKQWKIFSWSATLLTAIGGGVVALKTQLRLEAFKAHLQAAPSLALPYKFALALAVVGLWAYSFFWIRQNWRLSQKAEKALCNFDSKLGIDTSLRTLDVSQERFTRGLWFGYNWALFLVVVAVLWIVFYDPVISGN